MKIFRSSLLFFATFLLFFIIPNNAIAANIRVAGFNSTRSTYALFNANGSVNSDQYRGGSKIVNALNNSSNFGSGGVVSCDITFLPFVSQIQSGSLVENGQLKADVFFAGVSEIILSNEETQELKDFLNAGGIVYLSGSAYHDEPQLSEGPNYNPLFIALGIPDRFSYDTNWLSFAGRSSDPPDTTPITDGSFGKIGTLYHGGFRIFAPSTLSSLATGFETEEGTTTFSVIQNLSMSKNDTILAGGQVGSGYLAVSGDALYINWNVDNDSDNLNFFLNLFAMRCGQSSSGKQLNVPVFKQTDSAWRNQEYDAGNDQHLWCGSTIGKCGCALTSLTMLLKYYGIDKDPYGNPTTPETVNNYFKQGEKCETNGCTSLGYFKGNILWPAINQYARESNRNFSTQKIVYLGPRDFDSSFLSSQINGDKPVVIRTPGSEHWVVATGISGGTFNINDPGYSKLLLSDVPYNNNALSMRLYEKTASDFSSFEVTSLAPAQIMLTDEFGRRTGFDKETGTMLEEIPNSFYYFEESYDNIEEDNSQVPEKSGIYTALILTPPEGIIDVEIIGQDDQLYSFTVHASDRDANVNFEMFEDENSSGEGDKYEFSYSPEISDAPMLFKIPIIIKKIPKPAPPPRYPNGFVEIQILSAPSFNPYKDVDRKSLTFGKTGDENSLWLCPNVHKDVNRDGKPDIVCYFSVDKGNVVENSLDGILKGKTYSELRFTGHM